MQTPSLSRRDFIKIAGVTSLAMCMLPSLSACGSAKEAAFDKSNWDAVLAAAKGQEVSWYGWGGDQARNNWIEQTLAPRIKEKYGVTLKRVDMDINDILTLLSGEIQAKKEQGSIDFIWINGENFFSCKEKGYLWGPFSTDLPNYQSYIDTNSASMLYDFGSPIDGYEAPYGRAQMQLWCDGAKIDADDMPTTVDKFTSFIAAHPGCVTYPEPGDFTGTAFAECLIAGVIGRSEFEKLSKMSSSDATEEAVSAIIQPGLDYLKTISPKLWKEGSTYPGASTELSTMYADGELVLNMGYGAPLSEVKNGSLPNTTKGFVFDFGTVGNVNFNAIAQNAPHKAGAMVCINEILSPEMQLSIYENLGGLSVLDMSKVPADIKASFEAVELEPCQVSATELTSNGLPEASGPAVPVIESLWRKAVLS